MTDGHGETVAGLRGLDHQRDMERTMSRIRQASTMREKVSNTSTLRLFSFMVKIDDG